MPSTPRCSPRSFSPFTEAAVLETTARKYLDRRSRCMVREDPQPDPTTSLLPARLIGVDRRGWPAASSVQGISGGLGTASGKTAAWHVCTMWSAPRGNPASARIPGGSCRTTPRRSSSGTRRRRAAWARNAPCPPRTPSKSAADAGHGHADHTPGDVAT